MDNEGIQTYFSDGRRGAVVRGEILGFRGDFHYKEKIMRMIRIADIRPTNGGPVVSAYVEVYPCAESCKAG